MGDRSGYEHTPLKSPPHLKRDVRCTQVFLQVLPVPSSTQISPSPDAASAEGLEASHESEPARWDGWGKTSQGEKSSGLAPQHCGIKESSSGDLSGLGRAWDTVDAG